MNKQVCLLLSVTESFLTYKELAHTCFLLEAGVLIRHPKAEYPQPLLKKKKAVCARHKPEIRATKSLITEL